MKEVYIYTLTTKEEPSNIRYVGKTTNLNDRLKRHLSGYYLSENTYKARWLKKILKEGKTPIIEILDVVLESDWQFWEQYWIAQLKAWNFKLTNTTLGGDGLVLTQEIINKRSQKLIGRKLTKETVKKIGTTRKKNAEIRGYWTSEDTKEKIKNSLTGYKHTEETKNKLSNIRQGSGNSFYNQHHTSATVEKLKSISRRKIVQQFTVAGEFLAEFMSIRDAEKNTNISRRHISGCCNQLPHYTTAGGFVWKFKIDNF